MNPHVRSHLAVLLALIAAAIAVTWPLVLHMNDGIPYGGDGFQFIWNGWWFDKAMSDPDLSLWWTPWQYHYEPYFGASLAIHDLSPLNAFFQSKLSTLFGDFGAQNLLILFHYVLGAWGAYILAWYLTGNRGASVVAGVIYGFSVFHAMHLSQLSTVSAGWLPLSIYYLLKYTRDGGWRDGVLSILMLIAAALSSWYHLAFAGVVYFGIMLIGQIGLKENLSDGKRWQRAIIVWAASILIISPLLFRAWWESAGLPVEWRVGIGKLYFLDPAWLIIPPPDHPVFGGLSKMLVGTIPGNPTEGVASLGLVAIVLGIAAWFRKNPTTRAWCWLGLAIFLLALGPTLTVLGWKSPIPGPFQIWSMIPGLNLVRVPARFVEPFTLTLAISAAGFLAGLSSTWRTGWRRGLILWVLPILILFETMVAPVPMVGSEYRHPALEKLPEIYTEATGDPNPPDLIVNFPVLPERAQFSFQQTIHEIPTVDGAVSNPPPGAREFLFGYNWNPEYLRETGVDMVLYQPWAATSSLSEHFRIGDREYEPIEFFRDLMGYKIAYEDENLIVFVP